MPITRNAAEIQPEAIKPSAASRVFSVVVRLPFMMIRGLTKAALYTAWCLSFYILSLFRPLTGVAMLAAIVMVPLSFAAFVKPEAANGMPSWAFVLMTFGFAGFSIGYTIFLDWITPPGLEDTAVRYRRSQHG
jgi:hypothetical protein